MRTRLCLLVSWLTIGMSCSSIQSPPITPPLPNVKAQISEPAKKEADAVPSIKETMKEPFTCKRDTDIRSIWIESLRPDGCKLWYSNYEKKGPAASAHSGLSHCQKVSENVRKNLQSAGFICQSAESTNAAR